MKSLSRVGLGLSIVFGCLFLALICEIYYLLWWKRRSTTRRLQDEYPTTTAACWTKNKNKNTSKTRPFSDPPRSTNPNFQSKPFDENGLETGLMVGPPRFLFTIAEETREDLESENGQSRKLSDLMRNGDTPYLTPPTSPGFFTPPLTPSLGNGSSHSRSSSNGYNPFYESSTDVEFSQIIRSSSSPPPKFKFLRDAEEKLQNKETVRQQQRQVQVSPS